jgi:hypothetical protein
MKPRSKLTDAQRGVLFVMALAFAGQAAGIVPWQWAWAIVFTLLGCLIARQWLMVVALTLLVTISAYAAGVCVDPAPDGNCAFSGRTFPAGTPVTYQVYVCDSASVDIYRVDVDTGGVPVLWQTVTQDTTISYVARVDNDTIGGLGDPGKSCTICLEGTSCFGGVPTPTPAPTPAPTPIGAIPRINEQNKYWLGIAVDAGRLTVTGLTVLAASFVAEGDTTSALFATATATAMGSGLTKIGKMADDPYDPNYDELAQPQPEPVPAEIQNPLRQKYIEVLNAEAALAEAFRISADRANSARQDGATAFEAMQVEHIRQLLVRLGKRLAQDATLQVKIVNRWPQFGGTLADPDYLEALRTAAKGLNP